jgi:carbamoyl-phosphate synthase / aspartate carbamoyltransferase
MVGYTEPLTDPSYEGQILVLIYPLMGSLSVPNFCTTSRSNSNPLESMLLASSSVIIPRIIVISSSLATWLKENRVPTLALYGVDTRALAKNIREKGSMLGTILARNANGFSSQPYLLPPPTYTISLAAPRLYKAEAKLHPSGRLCVL